jgi:hypothetical protein
LYSGSFTNSAHFPLSNTIPLLVQKRFLSVLNVVSVVFCSILHYTNTQTAYRSTRAF